MCLRGFLIVVFTTSSIAQDTFTQLLGNVELNPYISSGGSRASSASDLNCDFSRPCCWSNAQPPRDNLEFVQASSIPNDQKFQNLFGTSQKPTSPYLITSSGASSSTTYAILNSCILNCQSDSGTLTFKKWLSSQANFDVCTLPVNSADNTYSFCQTVSGSGTDATVSIPPQSGPFQIVITASNFVLQPGGAAIIDDINYSATISDNCATPTSTPSTTVFIVPETIPTTTTPPPPDFCPTIKCSFGGGSLCSYSGNNSVCRFVPVAGGRHGMWAGGVGGGPAGGSYAGTELGPGGKAILRSATFTNSFPTRIAFKYFDGPWGNALKGCVDTDANCPFVSVSQQLAADRAWREGFLDVQPGTHNIYFSASNEGGEISGLGVTDINIVQYNGYTVSC